MRRILLAILCLALFLPGCSKGDAVSPDSRRLLISAELDESGSGNHGSVEDLGGSFSGNIGYYGLKNVSISLQGDRYPLEQAIAENRITVEEMEAYAQIDARNGICLQESRSFQSLTVHLFTYPEFQLRVINDLYETPDGQQHYIHEFDLADLGTFQLTDAPTFYHRAESMDTTIDREDWGLDFQVKEADADGITLLISQSGGQQLGALRLNPRILVFPNEDSTMDIRMGDLTPPEIYLPMESSQEIFLPWPEEMPPLTAGEYGMRLYVEDIFDPEAIHPLMRDYTDRQLYHIFFSIP